MATSSEEERVVATAGAGLIADIAVETPGLGEGSGGEPVAARGYWEGVWRRLKRDKVALAGGISIIVLLFLAFIGAPLASYLLGHGPNTLIADGTNANLLPVGPMTPVHNPDGSSSILILGASDTLGRDELLRLLYGARVSFEVAVFATLVGVVFGVTLGAAAGYFRGTTDLVVSRLTELTMAFPSLLFLIALASTAGDRLNHITLGVFQPGIITLVIVISAFAWFYPARIIRGLVLSLREKEFIEAARMIGASDFRIIRSHLLPHLVAPIVVYSTLIVATNVLVEAGLSFLGVGIPLPTASWGNLLSTGPDYYTTVPWLMVWPGLAVLITVLSFNLLGDGLRDAFDPRSTQ